MAQNKGEINPNGSYDMLMSELTTKRGIPNNTNSNSTAATTTTSSQIAEIDDLDEIELSIPYSRASTPSNSQVPVLSSKEELLKNHAVKELISSEETYNSKLKTLLEVMSLEKFKASPLLASLHAPLQKFKNLSDALLSNLNMGVKGMLSEGDRGVLEELRAKLREEFFQVLKTYTILYDEFPEGKFPAEFKAINDHLSSMPQKLGLKAYLIEPIQRGARYMLLVNEIKNQKTSLNSNYLAECDSTVTKLSSSLNLINTDLAQKQDSRKTIELKTAQNAKKTEQKAPEQKALEQKAPEQKPSFWTNYEFGDITRAVFNPIAEGFMKEWSKPSPK